MLIVSSPYIGQRLRTVHVCVIRLSLFVVDLAKARRYESSVRTTPTNKPPMQYNRIVMRYIAPWVNNVDHLRKKHE